MALNEQKAQAIRLLSSGLSIPEAAKRVGVGRETVWRWTKEQEFSAELTLYKSQVAVGAQVALNHAVYQQPEPVCKRFNSGGRSFSGGHASIPCRRRQS